jgi:O-antigen ligase
VGSESATVATTNAIGRQRLDLYVAGSVFLLLVAYSPALYGPFWSIRFALTILLAGIGLPRLLPLLRTSGPASGRAPAAAALAFLSIAVLATLASGHLGMSVLGLYNWGTGLLFVAGLVGGWAAAASAGPGSRRLVERAFLAGALLNAAIGVLQGGVDLHRFSLPNYQGRAHGLLGNPVHLGAIAAAAVAVIVARLPGPGSTASSAWSGPACSGPRRALAAIALAAAAVEASGARSGLVVLGLVLAWAWWRRDRRRAMAATLAAAAGIVAAVGILHLSGHAATGTASRLTGDSGGISSRIGHWRAALPAIGHRPLLGAGPGRFGAATTSRVSEAAARAEHGNRFVDAHNLVVEYATTTGLLGVAALLAWLVLAGRRGRGPLLGAALVVLAVGLVEPQSVSTTPVAFLLLGASAAPLTSSAASEAAGAGAAVPAGRRRPVESAVAALVAALAAVFAFRVVVGDWWLHETHLDLTVHEGRAALRVLPPWPVSASLLAHVYIYQAQVRAEPALDAVARDWFLIAADRDPSDPGLWIELADKELADGLPVAARQHYGKAHELDPWSAHALNGLGHAELALGHSEAARSWFLQSLRVVPNQGDVSSQLAQLG